MDFFTAMTVSSSALTAERTRINLISSNLANANSTRTAEGGPYKRKDAVFMATKMTEPFAASLSKAGRGLEKVDITNIISDPNPPRIQYEPTHPDANEQGFVSLPNVNFIEEMADMISATRTYEANVTAAQAAKSMAMKTLELGR